MAQVLITHNGSECRVSWLLASIVMGSVQCLHDCVQCLYEVIWKSSVLSPC